VIAEPRSNSLIVRAANPARLNLVRNAGRAAGPAPRRQATRGNIYVVYLRNAEAVQAGAVLRAALASMSPTARGRCGGGGRRRTAPVVTSGLSGAGSGTGTSAANAPITPRRSLPPAARSRPTPPPTR
jgi:general secretion pathway protein D